jgi:predicted  nucleic acid-binding Zn-ribbon protein
MDESKIAGSTNREALSQLRAHRVLLARRINEIALRMVDLTTELETLDEEMKAMVHQLEEVDRGIRALRVDKLSARHAGRLADMNRHPPS